MAEFRKATRRPQSSTASLPDKMPSWKQIRGAHKVANEAIRRSQERMSKNVKFTPREDKP